MGFARPPDASKKSIVTYLDDNRVLCEVEVLRTDRSAVAESICGCASCIPATVQTDGFDRCPRFLRRHEVRYMEAHFVMG